MFLFKLRQKVILQLAAITVAACASILLMHFEQFRPIMRVNTSNFFQALVYGALTACAWFFAISVLSLARGDRIISFFVQPNRSAESIAGSALFAAGGEEILFRGFIFAPLTLFAPLLAWALNFVLAYVGHFRRHVPWWVPLLFSLEATLYAHIYNRYHSLFTVAVAHGVCELIVGIGLHSGIYQRAFAACVPPGILKNGLSFRKLRYVRIFSRS